MSNTKHVFYGGLFILAVIAVLTCILLTLRAETKRQYSVPILMYHEIGEATNSAWCVPVENFRRQMRELRSQGYKSILPSDLAAHRKWGKPLPRKPIIITFDDGYLSNLNIVEPILKENHFRAISYLITSLVAERPDERKTYEGKKCLVWPEIRAMQGRGTFVFGGHSHTHSNLAAQDNPLPEIAECLRQLKLRHIRQPYSFCYPYGQQNQKTMQAVRQAGFQTAFVCEDAVASIGPDTDLFALPRVSVMGGSHAFRLLAKHFDGKALVYQIGHEGIPLEISACLCGDRNEKEALPSGRQAWLPPREIAQGQFELRFTVPTDHADDEHYFVEIWDKHRLFKLATINN